LMTASVSTHGMKGACFTDEEREMMYVDALTYYINNLLSKEPEQRIVFAENSGWDLTRIAARLPEYDKQRIEFVSLPVELFDVSRGKGYNEMLLINETVKRSQLVAESGGFFKVTGRYPVYNLDYFVSKASRRIYSKGYDMYCDIKDHKLYDWLRLGWNGHSFECRLFGLATDYWQKQFAEHYADCNDYEGRPMESVMFLNVKNGGGGKKSLRFRREPHFGGLEGSNIDAPIFTKEQDSMRGKFKRFVGNMIRTFLPWFWF